VDFLDFFFSVENTGDSSTLQPLERVTIELGAVCEVQILLQTRFRFCIHAAGVAVIWRGDSVISDECER